MVCASGTASCGSMPRRAMPVSTFRCSRASAPAARPAAAAACTWSWVNTVREIPSLTACCSRPAGTGPSTRIGQSSPARRSSRASSRRATPHQAAPARSAARATGTAPCPWALALSTAMMRAWLPRAAKRTLFSMAARSTSTQVSCCASDTVMWAGPRRQSGLSIMPPVSPSDKRTGGSTMDMAPFAFELLATAGDARAGVFHTPHGPILTPAFAPLGPHATVKAVTPDQLRELGAGLILANAYHLYLRPGDERIAARGGLHHFMGWEGPILTDSGGFQLFSMADQRTVDDEGVSFRSHVDGSLHRFTPEKAISVQENLGADIIMALDECAEPLDRAYNEQALARTHAWALRCLPAKTRPDQALFAIVQGGIFTDLRLQSAEFLSGLGTPGLAIGGGPRGGGQGA